MCFSGGHTHTRILALRDDYLRYLKRRKYSPRTVKSCQNVLKSFILFIQGRGLERLQDVTLDDLDAYRLHLVDDRHYQTASLVRYMQAVRGFFNWLADEQHIFNNPTETLKLPRPERKLQDVPTETDMKKLLAQPDTATPTGVRDRAFMEVAYSTGCRLNEMLRMNVFDPDIKQGYVRVLGKGRKERVVPLGKQAIYWLKQYIPHARPKLLRDKTDQQALWVGDKLGRRHNLGIAEIAIRTYAEKAGLTIRVTPHSLRRACATHMLARGAHPVQIQMLLGHSSLRSLGQYLSVSITELRQAHERSKPGR